MRVIDIEALLVPISEEEPCGPDLEYDPAFTEVESLARGRPASEMIVDGAEATPPDWGSVRSRATELLGRSKDLRLIEMLTVALVVTEGLPGLHDGLALLREAVARYWEPIHPKLDPDDDNDPTQRMNIISALAVPYGTFGDERQFIRKLREVPLTRASQLGPNDQITMRDVLVANGELAAPPTAEGGDATSAGPDAAMISGAFDDTDTSDLGSLAEAAQGAGDELGQLDTLLAELVGPMHAPNLSDLQAATRQISSLLREHLARRGVGPASADPEAETAEPGGPLTGEIRSRDDVIAALDKVCRYYDQHEPSSPVPVLLRRAQGLVTKRFGEILKELTPGAMSEFEKIGGDALDGSD